MNFVLVISDITIYRYAVATGELRRRNQYETIILCTYNNMLPKQYIIMKKKK